MQTANSQPTVTLKNCFQSSPFILLHLAALSVFFVPFSWKWVALGIASYLIRMFGITVCYHRYFAHRSYKTHRAVQFCLAFLGGTAVQKGALWWASNHRWHHRFSDQPQDVHSPVQRGFFWSHVGWIMSAEHEPTRWDQIPDLAKYPELRFLNRYHLLPAVAYGAAIFLVGGLPAFAWGFLLSNVFLWHGTFSINSLAHVVGSRRYQTNDDSRNNWWLALLTFGEGWHNNHHTYMSSARQGFFWWEFDLGYYCLKAMSWVGLVKDIREPPLALLEAKRIKPRSPARHARTTIPLHEVESPSVAQF